MGDCAYCGMPATDKDHLTPVRYNYSRRPKNRNSFTQETVPCCRECNSLLGSKFIIGVRERAGEIAVCLEVRYSKILKAPIWTEEEIATLGTSLQRAIRAKQFQREEVLERIRNATSVFYGIQERATPLWNIPGQQVAS